MVDLHIHTNHSDGSCSPENIVQLAKKHNVSVIAITDHDEISGILPSQEYAKENSIKVIPGVELSVDYKLPSGGHFHLIGLFINLDNENLINKLDWLRQARRDRAREIITKLKQINVFLSIDELGQDFEQGSIGRPHIASLLFQKGYVKNISEAFSRFLKKGAPAYVPKQKLPAQQAIDIIHQSNGLAIMAHPFTLGFQTYPELGSEILKLKEAGLDGIEAYYSSHDRYITKWLLDFAEEYKLAVSGGSDFHGDSKPGVLPGSGRGDLFIPPIVYSNLMQHHRTKFS